jgi:hypothetical protein
MFAERLAALSALLAVGQSLLERRALTPVKQAPMKALAPDSTQSIVMG